MQVEGSRVARLVDHGATEEKAAVHHETAANNPTAPEARLAGPTQFPMGLASPESVPHRRQKIDGHRPCFAMHAQPETFREQKLQHGFEFRLRDRGPGYSCGNVKAAGVCPLGPAGQFENSDLECAAPDARVNYKLRVVAAARRLSPLV